MEFSASVGFVHKESVTLHGHTIVKFKEVVFVTIKKRPNSMIFLFLCHEFIVKALQIVPLHMTVTK